MKLQKFQKTVLHFGERSKHAPDVGKSLLTLLSESDVQKCDFNKKSIIIIINFRNFVFFYFREIEKSWLRKKSHFVENGLYIRSWDLQNIQGFEIVWDYEILQNPEIFQNKIQFW